MPMSSADKPVSAASRDRSPSRSLGDSLIGLRRLAAGRQRHAGRTSGLRESGVPLDHLGTTLSGVGPTPTTGVASSPGVALDLRKRAAARAHIDPLRHQYADMFSASGRYQEMRE